MNTQPTPPHDFWIGVDLAKDSFQAAWGWPPPAGDG
jgi:hypothetical protein